MGFMNEFSSVKSVDDLTALEGVRFLHAAYATLLGREPDREGLRFYLFKMVKGAQKEQIIFEIRTSLEGANRATLLAGLDELIERNMKPKKASTSQEIIDHLAWSQVDLLEHVHESASTLPAQIMDVDTNAQIMQTDFIGQRHKRPVFDVRTLGGVIVLTPKHCLYLANLIKACFWRIGVFARIITEKPSSGFESLPHFVICPNIYDELPGLYVAFQMEQGVSNRWFTDSYIKKLENSFAILEYSRWNIPVLTQKGLYAKQIYFCPVDVNRQECDQKVFFSSHRADTFDVAFYGDANNPRRREWLSRLQKRFKVLILSEVFGAELISKLKTARVVVNIHYYENALLETTRVYECLSLNMPVISEYSQDQKHHESLKGVVDFIADYESMESKIERYLTDQTYYESTIKNIISFKGRGLNNFEYGFYRFLLASDNISFDDFWELTGQYAQLPSQAVCLTLPENPERGASFERDNKYNFCLFEGLKHTMGWVGCGLSYKYMIKLAEKQAFEKLIICEDDVEFPKDYNKKLNEIDLKLQSLGGWDLFSGLISNATEKTTVLNVSDTKFFNHFIKIDRMTATVFNIYNASIFNLIVNWDDRNRDVDTNTIDRYLELNTHLNIYTTLPFLVGHKEDLTSTIWNFGNGQYKTMIKKSESMLKEKVLDLVRTQRVEKMRAWFGRVFNVSK